MTLLQSNATVPFMGTASGTSAQLPQSPCRDQSKQASIFSLTLEEIQLKSGKSFGTMNMDEFLANLWSNVDENQPPSQRNQSGSGGNNEPTLVRQGSFSIPTVLCKKTVDEVWCEIQKDLPQHRKDNAGTLEPPQRQQTLGEITLEDFLVKAGVVQESSPGSSDKNNVKPAQNNTPTLEAHFVLANVAGPSQQKMVAPAAPSLDPSFMVGPTLGLGLNMGNTFANNGYIATYPLFTHNNSCMVQASNDHHIENGKNMIENLVDSGVSSARRRTIDGNTPEVVVERRQRRMIKNRESAARSRARKQAYTVELEFELKQLKAENARLKQLLEENEHRRKQEVLKRRILIPVQNKTEKLKKLSRTVSMEW